MDHRSARHWLLSALLLLGMAAIAGLYRNTPPPDPLCASALTDAASGIALPLPLRAQADPAGDRIATLQHRFVARSDMPPLVVYVDQTSPFERFDINGRDLDPGIDLDRRDMRLPGPRIHPIPADALIDGVNLLSMRVQVSVRLGGARIGHVCVGEARALRPILFANGWRQIGIPAICLALLVVMGLIATTLSRLHRDTRPWHLYIACAVLAACAPLYHIVDVLPGGLMPWRAARDLSILLFMLAMHRLLLRFWSIPARRWSSLVLLGLVAVRISMLLARLDTDAGPELAYWLAATAVAAGLVVEVALRARHAPLVERTALRWALGFAIGCAVLETVTTGIVPAHALWRIYPLGTAALMATVGFLLVRRATTGTRLLAQATRTLGERLDDTLPIGRASSLRMWSRVSHELADDERQRMLGVIEEGFGTRMLAALVRIQKENPDSRLSIEIRRALIDLRLMIDAIDVSCQSVGGALATLRQRMEAPLAAAGLSSRWNAEGSGDLQVGSRRKLTELFRCTEELLSNVIQHAGAHEVSITTRVDSSGIVLVVEDDGSGLREPPGPGRGLRNLRLRMESLDGTFAIAARGDRPGTRAELRLPRI